MSEGKKYYSTPADVITYSGVKADDLWLNDDSELEELIESWLEQIADKIHKHQDMNYFEELEEIPPAVHDIAKRMCTNKIKAATLNRDSNITRIDEFTVQQTKDFVFTEEIRKELKDLPQKKRRLKTL